MELCSEITTFKRRKINETKLNAFFDTMHGNANPITRKHSNEKTDDEMKEMTRKQEKRHKQNYPHPT